MSQNVNDDRSLREEEDASAGEITLSRREFLKRAGTATAGAVAALSLGVGGVSLFRAPPLKALALSEGVVFPDPSLCIGCLACEVNCSRWHKEQGLSALPRIRVLLDKTIVLHAEIAAKYPGRGTFTMLTCKMCPEAPCVRVCPVDAIKVDERGIRYIDEERCIACGRCEVACPFSVDEAKATNRERVGQRKRVLFDPEKNTYTKCDLCRGRKEGPICVERCPINVRIRQGIVKSDTWCLDLRPSSWEEFEEIV